VAGDPSRLTGAFGNIVKNAIEYNREGGSVVVRLSTRGPHVHVRVEDTGIGIAARDLPRVFDRFYRADKARSRKAGGSGLGLAITKRVIEDHGGSIVCTSEVDRGTQFEVRLPAAAAQAA
jgi:signal transduction histidine kinase